MMKRELHIVRVWEIDSPNGGRPLVFEDQDGALWQLCEDGLDSAHLKNIEDHWVEHSAIHQYLPADITPTPKDTKPWDYEFALTCGAVLWVKPGKRLHTFRWGIRTQWRPRQARQSDRPSG